MKFLLVDDNEITLEMQKLILESYDLSVETANSGEKAIELARENEYNVILMDICMPQMSGYEAAAQIRKFDKAVPIIALSADPIDEYDDEYLESGLSGALRKPLQLAELKAALDMFSSAEFTAVSFSKRKMNKIFDYDELLSILKDERAVLQVLGQFINVHSHDCDLIGEHISNGDYLAARGIMHNIIGISGNLLCRKLYDISVRLGAELRQEKSDSYNSFAEIWKQTVGEISDVCSRLSMKYRPEVTKANWDVLWSDFCSLCRDFDVAATNTLLEHIKIFEEHMDAEELDRLKKAVIQYDFLSIIDELEGYHV